MNGFCSIHQVNMTERESKTKFNQDGSAKTYFAHIDGKNLCFGESINKAQTNGRTITAPVKKHDSMYVCNAMNNAVALVNNGQVEAGLLEDTFNRILAILETKT